MIQLTLVNYKLWLTINYINFQLTINYNDKVNFLVISNYILTSLNHTHTEMSFLHSHHQIVSFNVAQIAHVKPARPICASKTVFKASKLWQTINQSISSLLVIHEIYAYTKKEKKMLQLHKTKVFFQHRDFNTTRLLPGCNGIYHTSLGFLEGFVGRYNNRNIISVDFHDKLLMKQISSPLLYLYVSSPNLRK